MPDYIDYIPEHLQEILDFKALNRALTSQTEELRRNVRSISDESVVTRASEYGIGRFEDMLQIAHDDTANLEVRRFRIISKINNRLPYSKGWLIEKLTTVFNGKDEFKIDIDLENYVLTVEVDNIHAQTLTSLYNDLRQSIPANMILYTKLSVTQNFNQYTGFVVHCGDEVYI